MKFDGRIIAVALNGHIFANSTSSIVTSLEQKRSRRFRAPVSLSVGIGYESR